MSENEYTNSKQNAIINIQSPSAILYTIKFLRGKKHDISDKTKSIFIWGQFFN